VNLRGVAIGDWTTPVLDENLVKVTKVEFALNAGAYSTIVNSSSGITGPFYYSPDGSSVNLTSLLPANTLHVRLTVLLDTSANNDYQGQTFQSHITVNAKQTNAPTF
jgi:hypothetical protein